MFILTSLASGLTFASSVQKRIIESNASRLEHVRFVDHINAAFSYGDKQFCGPSTKENTMVCFDASTSAQKEEIPIFGSVSLKPTYVSDTGGWIVGTSKGWLIHTDNHANTGQPVASPISLWGGFSRIWGHRGQKQDLNVKWVYRSSSDFIGEGTAHDGVYYTQSASQFIQAFEIATGRLLWASRLAAESPLRLRASPLATSQHEVIAGSSDGFLSAFDLKNGSLRWRFQLKSQETKDSFEGIAGKPWVQGKVVFAANAESMTVRFNTETKTTDWSYPLGSIGRLLVTDRHVVIPGQDGRIVLLDAQNGQTRWISKISHYSPVASLRLLKPHILIAVTKNGQVFLLNYENGVILDRTKPLGLIVGEFFSPRDTDATRVNQDPEVCITFVQGFYRCFKDQEPKNSMEKKSAAQQTEVHNQKSELSSFQDMPVTEWEEKIINFSTNQKKVRIASLADLKPK